MLEQLKLFVKMVFKPKATIVELGQPRLLALSFVIYFLNTYADPAKWQAFRNGVPTTGSQFLDALIFLLLCLVLSPAALLILSGLLKLLLSLFKKRLSWPKVINLAGYVHSLQVGIFLLLYTVYFSLPKDTRVFVKYYDWGGQFSHALNYYTVFMNLYILGFLAYGLIAIPGENETLT